MRLHFPKMVPRYRLTKPSYLETATNDMAKYVGCLFFSFSGLSVCLLCRTDSVFYSFSVSFLQWGGQISRPELSRSITIFELSCLNLSCSTYSAIISVSSAVMSAPPRSFHCFTYASKSSSVASPFKY